MSWFCPEDFEPNEKSREFARKKGLTDEQIDDQVEAMKDWEFTKKRTEWQRVFRNWIRQGIQWGQIVPVRMPRKPERVSEEQRQQDIEKWEADMKRLGVTAIKR